jgi:RHS repeat-associated protein
VVVDDTGIQTRREEYTPYGETSFGSHTRKRYRFTGQERDEESGLAYEGARYFAAGLGRWLSCDPAGVAGGINLFAYSCCNPNRFVDPSGTQPTTPDAPRNYELPAETIEVSGTAPPDVVGSAVKRGIINPLPNRQQIATNLIAYDKQHDALAAQRHEILSESDPEQAQAELDKRVEKVYGRIVADAEAELEKTHRMSSSVMPFVGIALVGSALAAAGAWAEPCLAVVGEGTTAGTAAAGRFAAYAGAATFFNWASGRDRDSPPVVAGTQLGNTSPTTSDPYAHRETRTIVGYKVELFAERVGSTYSVTVFDFRTPLDPATGKPTVGVGFKEFGNALKAEAMAHGASTLEVTGTMVGNPELNVMDAARARIIGFPKFQRVGPIEFVMRAQFRPANMPTSPRVAPIRGR